MPHDAHSYSALGFQYSFKSELSSSGSALENRYRRLRLIAVCTTVLALFVSSAFIVTQVQASGSSNCGKSSDEARLRGCRFDVMSFTWSQPSCFDGPLMEEFLSLKNWTWWLPDTQEPETYHSLGVEDVSSGQYAELHVSWEYHLYHCTYMWRKMHRAILKGEPLDSYVGNWAHTEHCEMMLLDRGRQLDSRKTVIKRKFPDCPGKGRETFVG